MFASLQTRTEPSVAAHPQGQDPKSGLQGPSKARDLPCQGQTCIQVGKDFHSGSSVEEAAQVLEQTPLGNTDPRQGTGVTSCGLNAVA
eukprot:3679332-Amphidinium_carterae.3